MADNNEQRWHGHPMAARAIRVIIFVVPFITAMAVAFFLSTRLPLAESTSMKVVRWLGIVVASTIAMTGVDRIARRLLPLSTLLQLTLLFPDQAPSRFRIAMRTGTTHQLRRKLDEARAIRPDETPSEAAERLLELVGLLSQHDRLTRGHSERVRAYTHLIGQEMGLTEVELDKIRWAGLLHDVGKTAIATEILNKPGRLTDEEYDTIKTHPMEGRALVQPLADWLGDSLNAVWEHHERFDGGGYPQGLVGTDISIAARIVCVADSYDVMTSARSYKKPMAATAARAELAACSGTHFDPVVVRSFLNISLGRLRLMTGPLAWFAQLALFEPSGVVHAGQATGGVGSAPGSTATSSLTSAGTGSSSGLVSTGASTAAAAGSSGALSTAAAVTVSVAASTAGIVAAAPPVNDAPVFEDAAIVTTVDPIAPMDSPEKLVLELDSGNTDVLDLTDITDVPLRTELPEARVGAESLIAAAEPGPSSGPPKSANQPPMSTTIPGSDDAMPTTTVPAASSSTTVPTTSPSATSAPATTAPQATTTSAPSPSGTTLPAATTTTTAPAATTTSTTTTTTAATTTTTTTTSTTTTTTLPGGVTGDVAYLGGGVHSDVEAYARYPVNGSTPPDIALPNYDTDRDAAPGYLLPRSSAGAAGTDPTKILRFSAGSLLPRSIDGDIDVTVHAAATDFASADIDLEVGLYRCTVLGPCVLLGVDERSYTNADAFSYKKFDLDDVDTTIGPGSWLEVRIANLDSSEADAWIAFGTATYPSEIEFPDDD